MPNSQFRLIIALLFLPFTAPALSAQIFLPLEIEDCDEDSGRLCDDTRYDETIGLAIDRVNLPGMDYYAPVPAMDAHSALIVIPGGGYQMEAYEWEGEIFARRLTAEGIHVFVLRYRLPVHQRDPACRSKVAMTDAGNALLAVRAMGDSLGLKQNKVGIMGFSAGGHLAATLSVHVDTAHYCGYGDSSLLMTRLAINPDVAILVYPVTIMDDSGLGHAGSAKNLLGDDYLDHPERAYFDLPTQITPGHPPTILFHASDDKVVPVENSLRYYQALINHEVDATLHVYHEGGHGFSMANHFDGPVRNWTDTLIEWLGYQGFTR